MSHGYGHHYTGPGVGIPRGLGKVSQPCLFQSTTQSNCLSTFESVSLNIGAPEIISASDIIYLFRLAPVVLIVFACVTRTKLVNQNRQSNFFFSQLANEQDEFHRVDDYRLHRHCPSRFARSHANNNTDALPV